MANKSQNQNQSSEDKQSNTMRLRGKLMWVKVFEPDPGPSNKNWTPKWQLDLLLDKENLKKATDRNLNVKREEYLKNRETGKKELIVKYENMFDGYDGSYLKIGRKIITSKGKEAEPPAVKYADGKRDIPDTVKIGNGSEGVVRFLVLDSSVDDDGHYGTYLLGLQVINLVEYQGGDDDFDDLSSESDYTLDDDGSEEFEDLSDDQDSDGLPAEWK